MLGFLALLGGLAITPPCDPGVCSCAGRPDVPSALQSADAVFTGRVVSVRNSDSWWRGDSWPSRRVTLRVDRAWKGVDARTVMVITGMGGGDCGFPFRRGESYLVYAYRTGDGSLGAGICGRTAELVRAGADIRALGPATAHWRR